MNGGSVAQYIAAQSGAYLAFVYGGPSIKTGEGMYALGYFDVNAEKWISVSPPPVSESATTPLKTNQ